MRNSGLRYIAATAVLLLALAFSAALLTDGDPEVGDKPTATPPPVTEAQEPEPTSSLSETWTNNGLPDTTALLDIPLDPETQWAIYTQCGFDRNLFCRVMAIANRETGGTFRADTVGDNGGSIGMFQINTRWHTDRMERLSATNFT